MNERGMARLGLVAIGRNEGARLRACLASVSESVPHVVYVDSDSTDDSVAVAQAIGVQVVRLDMTIPFTAARARNEGWRALLELTPDLEFIQFIDGDCVVADGWIETAQRFLEVNTGHAAVCGRRREKYPDRSIYNHLCDLEWDTPVGETKSCGGDVLIRVSALKQLDGYRDDLIAGEEPELCVRMRQAGWRIYRLDAEMTVHDAAMTRWSQWWRRSVRAGFAFAEGSWLHGTGPSRHWIRETLSAVFWGGVFPLVVLALTFASHFALVLFLVYPLQVLRLSYLPGGISQSLFLMMGKFAEFSGVCKFYLGLLLSSKAKIIEYK